MTQTNHSLSLSISLFLYEINVVFVSENAHAIPVYRFIPFDSLIDWIKFIHFILLAIRQWLFVLDFFSFLIAIIVIVIIDAGVQCALHKLTMEYLLCTKIDNQK